MQFTEDQQKVIETRNKNILVSAAAGSGKTAVLVERILSLITDETNPVDIYRLLIVTFTSAAAAEMRERVHAAILKKLALAPENENLQRQSALIHNAQITTIDSFCLFLLKNHFHEIDLDPAFRIGDPGEIKLMEKEILTEVLEEFYEQGEESFLEFADAYCPDGKDGRIESLVEELYHYSVSHPWPLAWLKECDNQGEEFTLESLFESEWMQYAIELAQAETADAQQLAEAAMQLCEQPDGPYMYAPMIEKDMQGFACLWTQLQKLQAAEGEDAVRGYERLGEMLFAMKFAALSRKSDDTVSADKKETVKGLRETYKKMAASMQEELFVDSVEEILRKENASMHLNHVLIRITEAFTKRLAEEKKKKNILDFADVEHYALQILLRDGAATKTAEAYRDYFYEIMIDEYQDSNMVQELLLSSISREAEQGFNRFMVGDMKQSIYKFRLARPEIFMEKYRSYQKESADGCLIGLKKNFRSRQEVLDAANDVFSLVMRPQVGGITYDEQARLYFGASYPPGTLPDMYETELLMYEKKENDTLQKRNAEACMIAQRIRQLVGSFKVVDTQKQKTGPAKEDIPMRSLTYRDIVILVRGGASITEEIRQVLLGEGIPVHVTSKTGYFSAIEVSLLMDFLKILHNPYEDIPFCSVALSLFFGFTQEELAIIRLAAERDISMYESFRQVAAMTASEGEQGAEGLCTQQLREKTAAALLCLDTFRRQSVVRTMTELVNMILKHFHYMEYVTAMPAGEQRRANIEMFVEKTVDFEKTSFHGLFHFIRYMEQLKKYDVDFGEAATLAENADVVRIMTIHKSKGLEFPVCFVAGMDKRYNLRDTSKAVLLDADWGIASDYINVAEHLTGKTLRKKLLSQKMRRDSLGEELRILYVAMTRAKEKLILTGTTEKLEKKLNAYSFLRDQQEKAVPVSMLADANSSLTYLLMSYAIHPQNILLRVYGQEDLEQLAIEQLADREIQKQKLWQLEHFADTFPEDEEQREKYAGVLEKFAFSYPHEALAGLYTKTSVSELKKAAIEEEAMEVMFETEDKDKPYLPAFLRDDTDGRGGTDRGSAFHRLLELLDFDKYAKLLEKAREKGTESGAQEGLESRLLREELHRDIGSFVCAGRMSENYGQLISTTKIADFLQSSCAQRMARAQQKNQLYREQPFVIAIAASRLKEEFSAKEKVLIQGIIDVYFEEEDGIVILDYKTDRIGQLEELRRRYETQLDYYEEAVTQLTGKKVKEKILYSFALQKQLAW